ncbi:MAG: hypothetical protein VKP63_04785 [Cyanobacteriota bacterium]|nr:hypothetical protein [Cyanobacteriota bacterium]
MTVNPASLPRLALVLLLGLSGSAALAQPVGPMPNRDRLTPEQRQKIFPDMRRLTLQDHRERIAILQRAESCITRAASDDALAECMRAQREAMRQQRRQQMSELQALFQRNGLPMPQWRRLDKPQGPRYGRPGAGSGAGPGTGAGAEI